MNRCRCSRCKPRHDLRALRQFWCTRNEPSTRQAWDRLEVDLLEAPQAPATPLSRSSCLAPQPARLAASPKVILLANSFRPDFNTSDSRFRVGLTPSPLGYKGWGQVVITCIYDFASSIKSDDDPEGLGHVCLHPPTATCLYVRRSWFRPSLSRQ
jgi:hypothetical protein